MSRNILLVAAIVVIAGYFYFKSTDRSQEIISTQTEQGQTEQQQTEQQEFNPELPEYTLEAEDKQLVEGLLKEGIVEKIEADGTTPKVYVTAKFYTAPEVDKKAMLEVLYKTFKVDNPDLNSYYVYDAKSGDEVGIYDSEGFKIK